MTNIFIRNPDFTNFYGDCWPGNSTWIDFLNENAQNFGLINSNTKTLKDLTNDTTFGMT